MGQLGAPCLWVAIAHNLRPRSDFLIILIAFCDDSNYPDNSQKPRIYQKNWRIRTSSEKTELLEELEKSEFSELSDKSDLLEKSELLGKSE